MSSWLSANWRTARPSRAHAASPSSLPSAQDLAQDLVAPTLPQADRLHLAATCRTLRAAALRWFPEVHAELTPGDSAAAKSLAAWLCRYRARAHLSFRETPTTYREMRQRRRAVPATLRKLAASPVDTCVTSLGASPGSALAYHTIEVPTRCLLAFPSLEGLEGGPAFLPQGPLEPLWQLTKLRHLRLNGWGLAGNWAGVTRLPQLQQLELVERFDMAAVVSALPALAPRLTALMLHASRDSKRPASWAALAQLTGLHSLVLHLPEPGNVAAQLPALVASLQCLGLYAGGLAAAPPQLAACSRLTRLELGTGPGHGVQFSVASLSVLGALIHLQHLAISAWADSDAVPAVLSELSELTHLSLHARFTTGYAHLQPLTLLQELSISTLWLGQGEGAALVAALHTASQLTSLRLHGADLLRSLDPTWQPILQMTQLQALGLDECYCGPLPAGISSLQALTSLSLGRRSYHQEQEAVASLEHLRPLAGSLADLSLKDWEITAIPPVLTALTALTHLDLSDNPISGGLDHLRELPRLRRLEPLRRDLHNWRHGLTVVAALHLAANCRTMRAASLRWFPEVRAQLRMGNTGAAESLAAWLRRYTAAGFMRIGSSLRHIPDYRCQQASCRPAHRHCDPL
ncbi:hypothetical protein ABPG75_007851 [Micractinium tetrahymenae]